MAGFAARAGGSLSSFGYNSAANYSPDNYGRIVEGNSHLSYGPWIDPEIQRVRHNPNSQFKRRRPGMNWMGRVAF